MTKAFDNWKVVLLSIIGATTFWFFNALNKDYDARISYPVEFAFNRDSVVIMKELPTRVSIDVSSGGWNLLRKTFWFNVTPILIDLENPTEISYYTRNSLFPIVSDQLDELTINFLITDTLHINIEGKKRRRVILQLDSSQINLADNHRVVSPITIKPDTIYLVGPSSFIDTLKSTYRLSIASRGISSDFNRSVDVELPNRDLIKSTPERVRVQFKVEKFERHSIEIPIEPQNFPEDSSLYLKRKSIQVFYTIAESKQEDFSAQDFAITADLRMMDKKDSTVIAILVYHPEEALEIEVIPEFIRVSNVRE